MPVRVGIIGVGYMGRVHGRLLRDDKCCGLRAVFDTDDERKQEAAKELGCQAAASEAALLEQVDAVWIAVPNTLHAAVAQRALGADKHVFCEKPFATTLPEARQVRAAAASSKKVFQVGHNRRFAPVYQAAKKLLEAEEPTLAHFKMNRGELQKPAWTADRNVTGGYLYETPYHLFDLARWLFGEVAEVRLRGKGFPLAG
ncbi:MAG: Gfo/Idh/MocA family protein, partial [Terriglobia bacterium]